MLSIFKKITQISLILITVFSISNTVLAQNSVSNSLSSVYITMSPNGPRAGDGVELTVSSELLNLDSAKITWYVDGAPKYDTSSKSITLKAKTDGQKTIVRVVVETPDGIIKEATREFSPAGVDLITEPLSYTLPFYKGKPLFIKEGIIKIVAIPDVIVDGTRLSPADVKFRWSKDNTILNSNSGKGKNYIIVTGGIPIRDINIQVEIIDDSGNVLTQTSKTIFAKEPQILFYENSPLYGILYNKAIVGNYYLGTREELNVTAKPFSFNFTSDTAPEANYTWYANGNYVPPTDIINEILLRQTTTNLKGTASISLDLKNTKKIFQSSSGNFNVQFGI